MDLERIESLIEVVKTAAVSELSVRRDGSIIVVKKPAVAVMVSAEQRRPTNPRPAAKPDKAELISTDTVVNAPMVGIFHLLDGIVEGADVKTGQTVGAIESMKLMNEVKSGADGTIAEAYVEDGMPVEFGQSLFRLSRP